MKTIRPRKRPGDLLKAARQLKSDNNCPFTVVMAGSGELEPELRRFCADHGLEDVVFTGFVNQSELPALYGAVDIFVLPSESEPWGLAVNEAMCPLSGMVATVTESMTKVMVPVAVLANELSTETIAVNVKL